MDFNNMNGVYSWILLTALICRIVKCDKLDGYSFPVYTTTSCPRNQSEWRNRSSDLNCTESNGYMCIPNENITQLLEFCYRYPRIPIEKDICLILKKSTSLVEAYSCKQFRNGCPDKQYWSNEVFEYPSCISIGNRCFLAEPVCKNERIATIGLSETKITQGTTNVYLGSTILNTSLGNTHIQNTDGSNTLVWILVIGVFLLFGFILVCVHVIILLRRGSQGMLGEGHEEEETIPIKMDISGEREVFKTVGIYLDDYEIWKTEISVKIPEEVLQWDLDARSRYLEYLNKGKTPIFRARGMIVGCAGAGKTTLLERLQGKSLEDIQKIKSTVGLDVHNDIFEVLENKGKLEVAVRKNEPAIHIKENVPIDHTEKIEETKLLSILDFGGQCMYYACHQIYLSKRAFYILVVDMSKNLEDVIDEELCDHKDTMFSEWRNKDYLLFWLKSVDSYCGSKAPVILVATHAEEKSEQEKTKYYQRLIESFPVSSTIKTHLSSDRYFTLSLKEHDRACVERLDELEKNIVEVLKSQKHWGEEIPLDWAIFEKFISEKKEAKLQTVYKLKESFDEVLLLSRQEFKDLLHFYHDIGVILYFPFKTPSREYEELVHSLTEKFGLYDDHLYFGPEIVILDIQWFVNSFKYVMTDSKQASFNKIIDAAPTREALDTFKATGEISGTFLKAIWRVMKNQSAVEYKDNLMKYMERLGLMAIDEKSDICFIPSMNRMTVPQHVKSKINSHPNKSPTLYFRFPVLPVFLFYRMIVLCLKRGWQPLRDGRKCVYIDTAMFYFQNHVLVFGVSESYIQLLLYSDDQTQEESIQRAFNDVQRKVMKMLSSLTKTFNSNLHYQVGYSCTPTEFGKELNNTFLTENDLLVYSGRKCPLHAHAEDHDVAALCRFLIIKKSTSMCSPTTTTTTPSKAKELK